MKGYQILSEMADNFSNKIDNDFQLLVQFHIRDSGENLSLSIKDGKISLKNKEKAGVDAEFFTTTQTLEDIYTGKMTAFTAAGKAHISDNAPLDVKFASDFTPDNLKNAYYFLMHFFNRHEPEKILLGKKHSRIVHGAHAIPLYYHPGFRSAWYQINKGQKMNEPDDTNPFSQAVIVVDGKGKAKIGDEIIMVKANESYYIPPNSDHVFWTENEQPLVLIWLAWGEGA
ncbi:cupin domain-containing protein [Candidatus Heimdallarchaeota archaeon]|nr:MAG: cupin domain-containing protein [Candidatus Heimdallarchaeota archaeon]